MDYEPMNNQGGYEVNAELKRPLSGAELKEVVDAAPKYPAGGHIAPGPVITNDIGEAINNGFAAVCSVLRYGYQQVEQMVNLCDARLNPGIVWHGRLHYLVEDTDGQPSCDNCALHELCDKLTGDYALCEAITGDSDHHFKQL